MTNQNEPANPDGIKNNKKSAKALERVTIEDELKEKLTSLTAIANESLQGIAEVSKSDVLNLILKLHDNALSKTETDELRKIHFDVFKCLAWLQGQAKDAKDKGNEVSLRELFDKSNELMGDAATSEIKKIRKPRKNKRLQDNADPNSVAVSSTPDSKS